MRTFLALPLDPAWSAAVLERCERLRPSLPLAAWTRPEAWHVTVKFLGELDEQATGVFADRLDAAAGRMDPGALVSGGALVLPPRGRPRVLAIGFAASPAFESVRALARGADTAAQGVGVALEERDFRPHVTLARLRDPWPASAVDAFRAEVDGWELPAFPLSSCVLFRSRLERAGAVHVALRVWEFQRKGVEVGA